MKALICFLVLVFSVFSVSGEPINEEWKQDLHDRAGRVLEKLYQVDQYFNKPVGRLPVSKEEVKSTLNDAKNELRSIQYDLYNPDNSFEERSDKESSARPEMDMKFSIKDSNEERSDKESSARPEMDMKFSNKDSKKLKRRVIADIVLGTGVAGIGIASMLQTNTTFETAVVGAMIISGATLSGLQAAKLAKLKKKDLGGGCSKAF